MKTYAAIIQCIESGANRAPDISERLGITVATAHARLHELKRLGVVRPVRLLNPNRKMHPKRHGEKYKRYLLIRKA